MGKRQRPGPKDVVVLGATYVVCHQLHTVSGLTVQATHCRSNHVQHGWARCNLAGRSGRPVSPRRLHATTLIPSWSRRVSGGVSFAVARAADESEAKPPRRKTARAGKGGSSKEPAPPKEPTTETPEYPDDYRGYGMEGISTDGEEAAFDGGPGDGDGWEMPEGVEEGSEDSVSGEEEADDPDELAEAAWLAQSRARMLKAGGKMIDPRILEEVQLTNTDVPEGFRTGFVTIVGSPNVGKSTLMNNLLGERLSIVTSKAQTTRHRILGIANGPDFQIIYSDTPGVLQTPAYKLQEGMMNFVKQALKDADMFLFLTDVFEKDFPHPEIQRKLQESATPLVVGINKMDLMPRPGISGGSLGARTLEEIGTLDQIVAKWQERFPNAQVIPISAREGINTAKLLEVIKSHLPESPPMYPDNIVSDRPQRFFASELIREAIFTRMGQEIPYSCEVLLERFKQTEELVAIDATIMVMRDTQKGMMIGKGGAKIKELGTAARQLLEQFFDSKVYLKLGVKVDQDWRRNPVRLKQYGYLS